MCVTTKQNGLVSASLFFIRYIPVEYHWLVFLGSELADINLEDEPTIQDINLEDEPTIQDINLEDKQYKI